MTKALLGEAPPGAASSAGRHPRYLRCCRDVSSLLGARSTRCQRLAAVPGRPLSRGGQRGAFGRAGAWFPGRQP